VGSRCGGLGGQEIGSPQKAIEKEIIIQVFYALPAVFEVWRGNTATETV
jgi:hypothetical protein